MEVNLSRLVILAFSLMLSGCYLSCGASDRQLVVSMSLSDGMFTLDSCFNYECDYFTW